MAPLGRFEIEVRRKVFPAVGEAAAHEALRDLRVSANHGEFVCLVGPSGCGKTTLLNIVAGLDKDYEGSIGFPALEGGGEPTIGYVFQTPRLLPWRTLRQNMELVLTPAQAASGAVDELLELTGLKGFANTYPDRLSVGMRRRAGLVRAFAVQPDLLLMDEPFVSLDEPTAQRLRALLVEIWQRRPTTVFFVTHDLREAVLLGDRVVLVSGAPGSVIKDLPIEIAREKRHDPAVLEELRRNLIAEHPAMAGGL